MAIKLVAAIIMAGSLFPSEPVGNIYSVESDAGYVGMTTRDFSDSTRSNWLGNGPRPLRMDVWYPAEENSGKVETVNDAYQFREPVKIRREGLLSSCKGAYPLILISHGSYGNSTQMRWLGHYLAAHGFISVAINHNGSSVEERQLEMLTLSEFCMWERPRDVSAALDMMIRDSVFGSRIDKNRIGVAGFSLGGATAIWTGGAILNMDSLKANAPGLPPDMMQLIQRQIDMTRNDTLVQQSIRRAQNSYRDDRIKAIFALAPAIGFGFSAEGLKGIEVPVQIVVGDHDVVTPMLPNAQHYANCIKNAKLIVLPGERGHYTSQAAGYEYAVDFEEVSKIAFGFFREVFR